MLAKYFRQDGPATSPCISCCDYVYPVVLLAPGAQPPQVGRARVVSPAQFCLLRIAQHISHDRQHRVLGVFPELLQGHPAGISDLMRALRDVKDAPRLRREFTNEVHVAVAKLQVMLVSHGEHRAVLGLDPGLLPYLPDSGLRDTFSNIGQSAWEFPHCPLVLVLHQQDLLPLIHDTACRRQCEIAPGCQDNRGPSFAHIRQEGKGHVGTVLEGIQHCSEERPDIPTPAATPRRRLRSLAQSSKRRGERKWFVGGLPDIAQITPHLDGLLLPAAHHPPATPRW